MSETITIREVDQQKTLSNVDKLKTKKQGGGYVYWVPEEDVQTTTKHITKNGTYKAKDDDKYGYSEVTVNVPGGNGSADSHGKPTGGDIKPGGAGSAVVGTDPETGNEEIIGVDENENLVKTPLPSIIALVALPTTRSYPAGSTLDFTGIDVVAKNMDGTTWTSADYPNGHIPMGELIFPVTTAPAVSNGERDGSERSGAYYVSGGGRESVCDQNDGTGGEVLLPSGVRYCGLKQAGSTAFIVIAISSSPINGKAYTHNGEIEQEWSEYTATFDGVTMYVWSMAWTNPVATPTIDYTQLSPTEQRTIEQAAYDIMFGGSGSGTAWIPVQWARPADGKILQNQYSITVTGSGTSDEGGGGGHSF